MTGDNSVMGLYDSPRSAGLSFLSNGMILPVFQMFGMTRVLRDIVNITDRNVVPLGPKCFNMIDEISSGPIAFDDLHFLIASATSSEVKLIS